jgi:hypothetical protein
MLAIPVVLCLVPLVVALTAWRLERRLMPPLPSLRLISFHCGVATGILGLLVTMSCWIDPYPLVRNPGGSSSIAWLDLAWKVAFITPGLSMILALFGRGWPRILLIASCLLSLLLTFGSVLQNGV